MHIDFFAFREMSDWESNGDQFTIVGQINDSNKEVFDQIGWAHSFISCTGTQVAHGPFLYGITYCVSSLQE